MTKQITKTNAKTNAQSKRVAQSRETPTIVLKTIHDDIMRANANSTLTTKKMRVRLRATMNDVHVRNSSWIFTQSQYDVVRSMFDDAYAQKIARAQKRDVKKRVAKQRDAIVETNADANENA